ncbi:MAG: hypothetical protein RMJ56_13535 [Gemmataceae bacterium]|nr:hypothetical protein [Gemmata sp.]MDW8198615.1 hypothetical protein [Gemmataceae bacterium]
MKSRAATVILLTFLLGLAVGCGPPGRVEERVIEVKPPPSQLEQAKQYLKNYANGQPLGSEAAGFTQLVESVRRDDPKRAEILEKGFADLQKPGINTAAKAKEILNQLEARSGN